jgi:lysozyme family protein
MNNYRELVPFFYKWEGGLSRDVNDSQAKFPCPTPYKGKSGYHTNKGIAYSTWVSFFGKTNDLRFLEMNHEDWGDIFKAGYWNKVLGDHAPYQSLAEVLTSWAWGSGSVTAIRQLQGMLRKQGKNIARDGKLSATGETFRACAEFSELGLFNLCVAHRRAFFHYITTEANGKTAAERQRFRNNRVFLRGWLNRLDEFEKTFKPK